MSARRLLFRARPDLLEALAECLFEAGARGLEEASAADALQTYVEDDDAARPLIDAFDDFRARVHVLLPDVSLEPAELGDADDGWQARWLDALEAEQLTRDWVLRPTTRPEAPEGERTIWFVPSASFGAGSHPTTRLVAQALEDHVQKRAGERLFDVGGGNGVLSLVALFSGASSALVVDIDPLAVAAASENASLNGLADRLSSELGSADFTDELFPLVVANIETRVLDGLAEQLVERLEPGGRLWLAGLLDEDADALAARYRAAGAVELARTRLAGWTLLELSR